MLGALVCLATGTVLLGMGEVLDKNQRLHDVDSDEYSVVDGDLSAVSAVLLKPCKLVRFFGIFGLLPA